MFDLLIILHSTLGKHDPNAPWDVRDFHSYVNV